MPEITEEQAKKIAQDSYAQDAFREAVQKLAEFWDTLSGLERAVKADLPSDSLEHEAVSVDRQGNYGGDAEEALQRILQEDARPWEEFDEHFNECFN